MTAHFHTSLHAYLRTMDGNLPAELHGYQILDLMDWFRGDSKGDEKKEN